MGAQRQIDDDRGWGRIRGSRPPLAPRAPLLFWLVSAIVLAVVVLGAIPAPGPLDDRSEGDQRPGFLIDVEDARSVTQLGLPTEPIGRRPVVAVFDRRVPPPQDLRSFASEVPGGVAVVFVVPDPVDEPVALPAGVRLEAGAGGRIAEAVGMPEPSDGGAPVGYAVVDREGRVRYATLDPEYQQHGFEIEIIAGALR